MTTKHHTPIVTGAAANAAIINAPLGDLDEAITTTVAAEAAARTAGDANLQNEIDDLIIDSGTSDAETISARGGYDVLNDRLNDLYMGDTFYVDAAFTGSTTWGRFATISAALAACTGGETIIIAPGIYTEHLPITVDGLTLSGAGMPTYDDATGRLVGGTIVRGIINMGDAAGITIRDLGVDLADYTANAYDCIVSTIDNYRADRTLLNLALRGNGDMTTNRMHGLYIGGRNTTVENVRVYRCYHGIAIHGPHTNLNNIYVFACYGSSIIPKAKGGFDVYDVNISNVDIEGTADWAKGYAGPLEIQCANSSNTYDININNVTAYQCVLGVFSVLLGDGTGSVHDINLTNCISRGARNLANLGDYRIKHVDGLTLTNCASFDRFAGYGFQIDDTPTVSNVYLYGCRADGSAQNGPYRTADISRYSALEVNHNTAATERRRNQFAMAQGLAASIGSVASGVGQDFLLSVSTAPNFVASLLVTVELWGGAVIGSGTWLVTAGYASKTVTELGKTLFNISGLTLSAANDTANRTITFTVTQTNGTATACNVRVSVLPLSAFYDTGQLSLAAV